jgi:hypothetical protein
MGMKGMLELILQFPLLSKIFHSISLGKNDPEMESKQSDRYVPMFQGNFLPTSSW